ncbi:MAG: efflux RND transporter periplasmic adaptor subunit [Deltaproteobacteria bacterium]|nr:MAG: efflux RND transporter periplasmic adaptor subunit [Deltaproteobacteria bacterium]
MRGNSASVSLIVFFIAVAGCQAAGKPEGAAGDNARPVRVVRVERADIVETIRVPAELVPYVEVKLYSQVPDRIVWFPFRDGDYVRKGQRVAVIRSEGMKRGLERMLAEEQALEVQLRNLESELARSRGLLRTGVITQPAFDKLKASTDSTRARLKALQAARRQMEVQAGNAIIRAPIEGVVAGAILREGDIAVPQVPLCRILQTDRLRAQLRLAESEVSRIGVGQKVKLKLDCCPGETFEAKIDRIFPYVDPATRTNTAEIVLDNPKDSSGNFRLKPGMFGYATIVVGQHRNALVVPEQALVLDNELVSRQKVGQKLRLAFVVEQGTARRKVVEAGLRKGQMMQVLGGLEYGQLVIIEGQHGLSDGQPVNVVGENKGGQKGGAQ